MERAGRRHLEIAEGGERAEEVERDCENHGGRVRVEGEEREAMQRKVVVRISRYHNHLDASIVTAEWSHQ